MLGAHRRRARGTGGDGAAAVRRPGRRAEDRAPAGAGPPGVTGGVRSPAVDVAVATLTGEPLNTPFPCPLSGTTTPLTKTRLTALYPTHAAFVKKWTAATQRLAREGYLTAAAAANLIKAAAAAPVP